MHLIFLLLLLLHFSSSFLLSFLMTFFSFFALLLWSIICLLYFTFDSALSCYYYPIFVLFFLFFSFRFLLLLAHTEYILPLTFNPSSGRKQDSGCRTKQWGRAKRAEKHRSILLHTLHSIHWMGSAWLGLDISNVWFIPLPTSFFLLVLKHEVFVFVI